MKRNTKNNTMERGKNAGLKAIRFRQSLFWDVDPKTIDPKRHARYIIERILELGNDKEVRWVWNFYPRYVVRDVVEKSRAISPQTKSLWKLLTVKQ